jgi:mRNA-degrading endonuclease RelE of RelBE toxin-antitoxin system
MVSEIQKLVNRLSQKEKNVVKIVTEHIIQGNFEGLDLKKMTGHKNIYRVRKGTIRIIFEYNDKDVSILKIERRNEQTYRDF